jgi:hypothetical protein
MSDVRECEHIDGSTTQTHDYNIIMLTPKWAKTDTTEYR